MMRAALLTAVALIACDGVDAGARIDRVKPAYGPLVGGSRVTVTGEGFAGLGPPVRVLVGGRAAPLAAVVDDATLEVVIPPGQQPGDAELQVIGDRGTARAVGVFHYSTPPTITAIEPADVLYEGGASITVSGSGFADEDAGGLSLVLDGRWITGIEVLTDTTLRFVAPPGRALAQPSLELVDARGRAVRPRAFRYVPSRQPGLLLFPTFGPFAVYFDPVAGTTVTIPAVNGGITRYTAVVRDPRGDYWAIDRNRRFGRIDTASQMLEVPTPIQAWFPTMIRTAAGLFAIDRGGLRFGRFDPTSGAFTAIGEQQVPCCGSYGLAADGDDAYLVARDAGVVGIAPVELDTGAIGTTVPLTAPPGFHVEEMRFFAHTLYATSRNGTLATIDPATGVVTVLPLTLGRFRAMELFE